MASPEVQAAPLGRRTTRSFSFHSDKSGRASNRQSVRVQETPAEKDAHRLHSKADPTLAMNEAEPCSCLSFPTHGLFAR